MTDTKTPTTAPELTVAIAAIHRLVRTWTIAESDRELPMAAIEAVDWATIEPEVLARILVLLVADSYENDRADIMEAIAREQRVANTDVAQGELFVQIYEATHDHVLATELAAKAREAFEVAS